MNQLELKGQQAPVNAAPEMTLPDMTLPHMTALELLP